MLKLFRALTSYDCALYCVHALEKITMSDFGYRWSVDLSVVNVFASSNALTSYL